MAKFEFKSRGGFHPTKGFFVTVEVTEIASMQDAKDLLRHIHESFVAHVEAKGATVTSREFGMDKPNSLLLPG